MAESRLAHPIVLLYLPLICGRCTLVLPHCTPGRESPRRTGRHRGIKKLSHRFSHPVFGSTPFKPIIANKKAPNSMRYYYQKDQTILRGAAGVRNTGNNPGRHCRAGAARTFSWFLRGILVAGTPHYVEAFSFYSLWITVLSNLCELPILSLFGFCTRVGCTGNVNGDICQDPLAYYCSKPTCTGEPLGICAARPEFCPLDFNPVCGCNYQTYDNDCNRQAAGVNKLKNGPCGQICSAGNSNTACAAATEFCDLVLTTCNTTTIENSTAIGECVLVGDGTNATTTTTCPAVYAPVCGCDGQTYDNDCLRIRARTYKASNGLCAGANCTTAQGCFGNQVYCDRVGNNSNCSTTAGQCVAIPNACPPVVQPVCGCDNKNYSSNCVRTLAGVGLRKEGIC